MGIRCNRLLRTGFSLKLNSSSPGADNLFMPANKWPTLGQRVRNRTGRTRWKVSGAISSGSCQESGPTAGIRADSRDEKHTGYQAATID